MDLITPIYALPFLPEPIDKDGRGVFHGFNDKVQRLIPSTLTAIYFTINAFYMHVVIPVLTAD